MNDQDIVELTEQDIPAAALKEPFDLHNVTALRWWLQCRGIKARSLENASSCCQVSFYHTLVTVTVRVSKLKNESMRINSNAMFFGRASLGMKKATTCVAVATFFFATDTDFRI